MAKALHPLAGGFAILECMKSFIVHVSDTTGLDEQAVVVIQDGTGLGKAVHLAIDEMVKNHGNPVNFPVFVDIQPTAVFKGNAWMYPAKRDKKAVAGSWN
jgi:hypothetical protein